MKKKLFTLVMVVAIIVAAIPSVSAVPAIASAPSIVRDAQSAAQTLTLGDEVYASYIAKLDQYGFAVSIGMDQSILATELDPNRYLSQAEVCQVLAALFPGRCLGIGYQGNTVADEGWLVQQLCQISRRFGYGIGWSSEQPDRHLTLGRACFVIDWWLDAIVPIRGIAGQAGELEPGSVKGVVGPDGVWHALADGQTYAPSGVSGYWYIASDGEEYWYSADEAYNDLVGTQAPSKHLA